MNLGGFLSNDSMFGRLMTRIGTLAILNILFVISCIPVITIGQALSALYGSIFEMLEEEESDRLYQTGGTIHPLKVYWKYFKKHFLRDTACFIAFAGIMLFGSMNLQICMSWQGFMRNLSSVIIAVMLFAWVFFIFLFPLLAREEGKVKDLCVLALAEAVSSPVRTLSCLILYTVPMVLILLDQDNKPLYAFIFCFMGFALIARICGVMMHTSLEKVRRLRKKGEKA